ncbi:hypothetical protein [Streptosporangium roseum]|uniref:hypothetical protein n=1 Tax=Streptosporangium roseum TaxID=2001 RepID=UPI00332C9B97
MYLVFPDNSWTAAPDEADIRKAVTSLTHERWNLCLAKRLSFDGDDDGWDHPDLEWYVQVACGGVYDVPEGTYQIEHRAGSHLRHYCAFTQDTELIIRALTGFARMDETWAAGIEWELLKFDDYTRELLQHPDNHPTTPAMPNPAIGKDIGPFDQG